MRSLGFAASLADIGSVCEAALLHQADINAKVHAAWRMYDDALASDDVDLALSKAAPLPCHGIGATAAHAAYAPLTLVTPRRCPTSPTLRSAPYASSLDAPGMSSTTRHASLYGGAQSSGINLALGRSWAPTCTSPALPLLLR